MPHQDDKFQRYATEYHPEKIVSIDGTDTKALAPYRPTCTCYKDLRKTVVVARLHPRTTPEALASEFSDCGKIISCRLIKDVTEEIMLYCGFIEFEQSSSVDKAISKYRAYIENTVVVVAGEKERGAESRGD